MFTSWFGENFPLRVVTVLAPSLSKCSSHHANILAIGIVHAIRLQILALILIDILDEKTLKDHILSSKFLPPLKSRQLYKGFSKKIKEK